MSADSDPMTSWVCRSYGVAVGTGRDFHLREGELRGSTVAATVRTKWNTCAVKSKDSLTDATQFCVCMCVSACVSASVSLSLSLSQKTSDEGTCAAIKAKKCLLCYAGDAELRDKYTDGCCNQLSCFQTCVMRVSGVVSTRQGSTRGSRLPHREPTVNDKLGRPASLRDRWSRGLLCAG